MFFSSIGLVEIERYEKDTLVRFKEIFDSYSSTLKKYKWAEIPVYEKNKRISSYHLYMLRIRGVTEEIRDQIIQSILEKGVSVNVHYIPLSELTFYKNLGYNTLNYPISFNAYACEITLPTFYDITDDQIEEVLTAVISSVEAILKK